MELRQVAREEMLSRYIRSRWAISAGSAVMLSIWVYSRRMASVPWLPEKPAERMLVSSAFRRAEAASMSLSVSGIRTSN